MGHLSVVVKFVMDKQEEALEREAFIYEHCLPILADPRSRSIGPQVLRLRTRSITKH